MDPFGYQLVVCEPAGEKEEVWFSTTRSPVRGEKFALDGASYVVVDVEHVEDDADDGRRRSYPRVYVSPWPKGPSKELPGEPTGRTSGAVLPFEPPSGGTAPRTSAILPPALVAWIVVAGYEVQRVRYRVGRRDCAELVRAGRQMVVIAPEEAWRLSRRAKRHMLEALDFWESLTDKELTWPSSSAPRVSSFFPEGDPRPARSSRPALRLVSV